ncbi:MAG: hypothetical protein M3R70_01090 [Actinomycetota bacterium]|nr:hypothetical protein [Actinomycetota bacterium]
MSASLILLVCALACPVGMMLMMLVMRGGHGADRKRRRAEEKTEGRDD